MIGRSIECRRIVTLLVALGVAASVAGCGRTLVFAEQDGVNFAIRVNGSSSTPIEANFGLNRTIATIVPPAGEASGRPDGDAVSMFASFQIDNTLNPAQAPLNASLEISTQFASGDAAKAVARNPEAVVAIVNPSVGAQLAARVRSEVDVVMAAISCGETMKTDLRDKLIAASGFPDPVAKRLMDRKTPAEFRATIRNSPGLVSGLHKAAIKQGRASCPTQ
jgi:hypothetical protein